MPSLRVPPPEIPVVSFLTPNKSDQGLLEFWSTLNGDYVPLDIGSPHPNERQYPNFRLGKQSPVQGDEKWTLRIWVTDETNPDWFDYALKYAGEDNAFPTFIRTYREPRNSYTPRTKGQPLSAIYKLVITDPGSGYTNGVYPNITFDAPVNAPTSDATGHGVVAPDGTITEAVLDFGGEGYDQDVEFHVDPPINGTPAQGIAYVQPQTAILTREEASLYPEDSPFYAQYLQVARVYETIPGPTFIETSLDVDGDTLTTATTRGLCADIVTTEAINAGIWCKVTKKPTDIDVICEQVVVCRAIPGIPMLYTTIDQNGDILHQSKTMVEASALVTTNVISMGVWTKTFQEDIDGTSLVSWKVIQVRDTQNELDSFSVEIPDILPREFAAGLPITETGETLIGDASLPTLATGDLFREERQLDDYTYRLTIRGRAGISLPKTIINYELTSEFGGGVVKKTLVLDLFNNLTPIDGSLTILTSEVTHLDANVNGLAVCTLRELDDTAWPEIASRLWDENYRVEYDETRQTVDAGTSEDAPPGGSWAWVSEVKSVDKWKSWLVNTSKPEPAYNSEANALISYEFKPFKFPGLLTTATYGYYVRSVYAELTLHKLRTWWVKSATTPTVTVPGGGGDVEIEEIIPETIIISTLNDVTVLAYSGMVLHDDITTFGSLHWDATTPDYSTYIASWQGVEKVIAGTITPEKEKDIWKIVTESVIMR